MNKTEIARIEEAKIFLDGKFFSSLEISYSLVPDKSELTVSRNGKKAQITYGEKSSLFRGLTVLKERKNEKSFTVTFHRSFRKNGIMHDSSRNGVMNVEQVKRELLMSALFGMNLFMLYTEDTYEIKDEPYFGYLRGRYTRQEIREIVSYADSFGIEVIPCIQTLSHLQRALRWSRYATERETWVTLLTGEEKTYELIEKFVAFCKENFHTDRIHIGMDEAFDLGTGRLMYQGKQVDRTKEFLTHLNRVVGICGKYGLQPMMWNDMFFKLNNATQDYYRNSGSLSPEIKKLIPDVDLVYWDYYHDDKSVYDRFFSATKDTGRHVVFAGGAIRWTGFAPNITQSMNISRAGLESAVANGIEDVFVTCWGDNGAECSVTTSLPAMALYSIYDFSGGGTDREISSLLEAVTGDSLETWSALELPNKVRGDLDAYENPSKPFFYQDVLLGMFDTKVKDGFPELYAGYEEILRETAKKSHRFRYVHKSMADFCAFLSVKVTLGKNLRKAYKKKDRETLHDIAEITIPAALKKLEAFEKSYRKQWLTENKSQGYNVVDGRIGYLKNRIQSARIMTEMYLKNEIAKIPELEETILPFDGTREDDPLCINGWGAIVTTDDIG